MPLVRTSVHERRRAIAPSDYDAMLATFGIAENDRFSVVSGGLGEAR